jgi:DNA-binding SARP family transcriptional activator
MSVASVAEPTPAPTAPALRVELFGSIALAAGDRRFGPGDFGGLKPKQLLEALLVARGRRLSKDGLADVLWGDSLPRNAAATLENYVSVLRRRLAPEGGGRELIVTEPGGYRLPAERAELDLDRFDDLIERAARSPTAEARRLWAAAIKLADRGELLEDEPYAEWVAEHRRTYRARLLGILLDGADAALAEHDFREALEWADRSIALDRFGERGYRSAVLALYALGRQHEALERYDNLRRLLDGELGLEPMPETRALQLAILRQEDVRALLPRPSGGLIADSAREGVPLLGRVAELDRLERAIAQAVDGPFALVVVEGEAGSGKSRLLDEALARLPGLRIGRATCCQLESHLAYVPLGMALRQALADVAPPAPPALRAVLPELGAGGDPPAELEVLEALAAVMREHSPLVLVLDDLHFADQQTIAALGYLRRRCADVPGAVLAAVRGEEAGPAHPLRRLQPTSSLRLEPLAAGDLIAHDGLYERTGGHPEFVAAAMSSGTREALAQVLAETILTRCRLEGSRAYAALVAASVLGRQFSPQALAAVLSADADELAYELERLCERRLLAIEGQGFRFRYDIVRHVLAQSLSPARRALLLERGQRFARGAVGSLAP